MAQEFFAARSFHALHKRLVGGPVYNAMAVKNKCVADAEAGSAVAGRRSMISSRQSPTDVCSGQMATHDGKSDQVDSLERYMGGAWTSYSIQKGGFIAGVTKHTLVMTMMIISSQFMMIISSQFMVTHDHARVVLGCFEPGRLQRDRGGIHPCMKSFQWLPQASRP